jgi:uncharacterized phage protein (TIGR01671 family)
MQREIKFRAWDDGKMNHFGDKCEHWHDEIITFFETIRADSIVMQYTGLKDKNGKDMYEGDIIQYDDKISVIRYSCAEYICDYYQKSDIEGINGFLKGYESLNKIIKVEGNYSFPIKNIEIIGNIYENPELLKIT